MQLQAACDNALRQRVFDTGTHASLTTEEAFLAKMKELSVIVIHKSILPDTSIAPAPSPPSSPSHSLPDSSPPPTIEQGAPGARNDDVIDSQLQYNPPPPGPKSQLPVHLREKWIVAREEPIKPIK